jgi:hypothetical protein
MTEDPIEPVDDDDDEDEEDLPTDGEPLPGSRPKAP